MVTIQHVDEQLFHLRAMEATWRQHREILEPTGDDNTIASGEYQACQAIIAALNQATSILARDHHRARGK